MNRQTLHSIKDKLSYKFEQGRHFREMETIRLIQSWIYGFYAWIIFAVCVIAFGGASILAQRSSLAKCILKGGTRLLFRLCGIRLSINGLHRLPKCTHILLLNHTSFLDPIALLALLPATPGYSFTARQEFKSQSLLYPLLESIDTLILKRHDQRHTMPNVDLLAKALREGKNLIIFPEGGFGPAAALQPFHKGAFVAAYHADVPIVIAALKGARAVLRPGTWMPKRTDISIEIGPVIYTKSIAASSIKNLADSAQVAMQEILKKSESTGKQV